MSTAGNHVNPLKRKNKNKFNILLRFLCCKLESGMTTPGHPPQRFFMGQEGLKISVRHFPT
jgi:hypothetical protein